MISANHPSINETDFKGRSTFSLLDEISNVYSQIEAYKTLAREFFYEVLFSRYRCPSCNGRLLSIGPSQASCQCGIVLDPTVMFQRSSCCGAKLVKQIYHYVCRKCMSAQRENVMLFAEGKCHPLHDFTSILECHKTRKK